MLLNHYLGRFISLMEQHIILSHLYFKYILFKIRKKYVTFPELSRKINRSAQSCVFFAFLLQSCFREHVYL